MMPMFVESSNQHYSEEVADEQDSKHKVLPDQPVPLLEPKQSAKSTSTGSKRNGNSKRVQNDGTDQPSQQEHQRRQRNKEAAKRSRARNKQRYDRLEERELELQRELFQKKQQLAQAKLQLQKYLSKNTLVINLLIKPNSLNVGKQMTYNRLEDLTQDPQCVDEDEVNLILDTLKLKVGATCKERQNMIDFYFKQWIHLCYPALHRFFMWTAELGSHDFGEQPVEWAKDIQKELNYTPEQRRQILETRDFFVESKDTLTGYIEEIHDTKQRLEIECEKVEHTLDCLRNVITPHQCAQMVLFCEKHKYKREVYLWSERVFYSQAGDEFVEPPTRKQVKH